MKAVFAILIAAIVAVALFIRYRTAPTFSVKVDEIAAVLHKLETSRSDPTFAVFMFSTPDRTDNETINIQFSIEAGRPGFDWVLLGQRNIEEQDRYLAFARSSGYDPHMVRSNGVRYLRVESGNLAGLCSSVITKMYGLPWTSRVKMIVEGFDPPAGITT